MLVQHEKYYHIGEAEVDAGKQKKKNSTKKSICARSELNPCPRSNQQSNSSQALYRLSYEGIDETAPP